MKESKYGILSTEILRFTGNSEQEVADKGWTINGSPSFSNGICTFISGTSDYIDSGNVGQIKTVIAKVKLDTTTEDIIDFDGSIKFLSNSGTLSVDNLGDEVLYVDGLASSSIDTNWKLIAFTTATGIDASTVKLGDGLDGQIEYVLMFTDEWSNQDILAWYEGRMFDFNSKYGVVGEWNLARNWLNAAGTQIVDATGQGNDATLTAMDVSNFTKDEYGRSGKALSFDEPEYLTTGNNTLGSGLSTISVFALVKPATLTGQATGFRTILSKGTDIVNDCPFGIVWNSIDGELTVLLSDFDIRIDTGDGGYPWNDYIGEWCFVGFTYDNSTVRIYFNGEEIYSASYSTAIDTSNEPLLIGFDGDTSGSGDRYWIGDISKAFVTNYVIGPAQLKAIWDNLQRNGFGRV